MIRTALLALALAAAPASAAVRTLLIGIDTYNYSAGKPGSSDSEFKDLAGAVNDVLLVRDTLAGPRFGLSVAPAQRGAPCPVLTGPSIILLDGCATRAAILAALSAQIAEAAPGDTLLVYYSGHGSQALDRTRTQKGGMTDTTLPADARGGKVWDILDIDLKRLIDAALARGVNVTTLFDSCNSGTATRDLAGGAARSVPKIATGARPATDLVLPPPVPGAPRGVRVHLSAAADGEVARETTLDGARHGAFTRALITALTGLDRPSHRELAAEIRRLMSLAGDTQTPGIEGDQDALFLGSGSAPRPRAFPATLTAPSEASMGGGAILGVTPGSTFGLYASMAASIDGGLPLARGTVTDVGAGTAVLALDAPLAGPPPAALTARELVRAPSLPRLRLRIDGGDPAERAALAEAAGNVEAIALADPPAWVLTREPGGWQLRSSNGRPVGTPQDVKGATANLRKLAQSSAVAALATPGAAQSATLTFTFGCTDDSGAPKRLPLVAGLATAQSGDEVAIRFANASDRPRWPYLIALGEDLSVEPLREEQRPMEPGELLVHRIRVGGPARDAILFLLTDERIDVSLLGQDAARSVENRSPLEKLLAASARGARGLEVERAGGWIGRLEPLVTAAKGPPSCPAS